MIDREVAHSMYVIDVEARWGVGDVAWRNGAGGARSQDLASHVSERRVF